MNLITSYIRNKHSSENKKQKNKMLELNFGYKTLKSGGEFGFQVTQKFT